MRRIYHPIALCIMLFCVVACGHQNYVANNAPKSLQEAAELDMEAGSSNKARYVDAQKKLEQILAESPNNFVARSLLAASYAAQGEVILLRIIQKLATSTAAKSSAEAALFWEMSPDPTEARLELMILANDAMGLIPEESLTAEMRYQKGVFLSIYAILVLKKIKEELTTLGTVSAENADLVKGLLEDAVAAAGGASSPFGKLLTPVLTSLNSQAGNSNQEQIEEWLGKLGG